MRRKRVQKSLTSRAERLAGGRFAMICARPDLVGA